MTSAAAFVIVAEMTNIVLDLTGLKCPLPVLKARKALTTLVVGDRLELHCTDPMSLVDIPVLLQETGDRLESATRSDAAIVFVIEKAADARDVVASDNSEPY